MNNNKLETIREIAIRNEVSFHYSMQVYTNCACKIYSKNNFELPYGHPDLEEKIFAMTEKYIGIKKWKELRKNKQ